MKTSKPYRICPECGKRMPPGLAIYCGRRCERSAEKNDPDLHSRRKAARLLKCLALGGFLGLMALADNKKHDNPTPSINAPTYVGSVTPRDKFSPATDTSAPSGGGAAGSQSGLGAGVRETANAPTSSNCSLEDPPVIPDGATATPDQMKSAQSAIASYGSEYRRCIDRVGDSENSVGYHRSLAIQASLGKKFDEEVQAYKSARTREAGRAATAVAETRPQNMSMSDTEKNGYAVGVTVGRKLKKKHPSIRIDKFLEGVRDEVSQQSAETNTYRSRKDRESYSLGKRTGRELAKQNLPIDVDSCIEGIRDAFEGAKLKMATAEALELVRQIDAAQPASTGRR